MYINPKLESDLIFICAVSKEECQNLSLPKMVILKYNL